jgi:protoheme IX farnesyltransferase
MKDYLALAKPRITLMVVLTAWIGYGLAGGKAGPVLGWTLLGVALASCSSGALNQVLEREADGRMRRTRTRPLPAGRLTPLQGTLFGAACAALGLALLAWKVNAASALLAAFTIATYVGVYTPLKPVTPNSGWVGAVSGAMPPLIGWAAARGGLDPAAWALFAIQFLWQINHILALFWLYREDYSQAGFRTTPVLDPGGRSTSAQIALHSFSLLPASLMPTLCGLAGRPYGIGALALGTAYLGVGLRASWTLAPADARRLFLASLAYLPLLFGLLVAAHA